MKKIWSEFVKFAVKGNILDIAVGMMIGTAFSKIVSSFINDMLMPVFSLFLADQELANLSLDFQKFGAESGAIISIRYGAFLSSVADFACIAVALFIMVKVMNRLRGNKNNAPEPPKTTRDQELLIEIRDLLKGSAQNGES